MAFNFDNSYCWLRCFVGHMFCGVALFVDGFNGWIKELNSYCWLRCFVGHMFCGVALFVDGFNGWIKELV